MLLLRNWDIRKKLYLSTEPCSASERYQVCWGPLRCAARPFRSLELKPERGHRLYGPSGDFVIEGASDASRVFPDSGRHSRRRGAGQAPLEATTLA